jgi:hypothetical protein
MTVTLHHVGAHSVLVLVGISTVGRRTVGMARTCGSRPTAFSSEPMLRWQRRLVPSAAAATEEEMCSEHAIVQGAW